MNIFNIKRFSTDDSDEFGVGGLQSAQPTTSPVKRPQKQVSHDKPFEKYMQEPKEGKDTDEVSKEAQMESPLLAKMGKTPAEMEELGGKLTSTPYPPSFPAKEKTSLMSSHPAVPHHAKKDMSTPSFHKMTRDPGLESLSTSQASSHHVKEKTSVGGEEIFGEGELASIEHKHKTPDEVVWGAEAPHTNKPLDGSMEGDASLQIAAAGAVEVKPKFQSEIDPREAFFESKEGMVVDKVNSKKIEESPVPVIGAEVKPMNVAVPHANTNISVVGVAPAEAKAPAASTSEVLKSLVEQIVNRVDTLTKGERMESVITLKQSSTLPPGFENATIRLTSVASARGEVNINFGGLTQSAVNLVQNNQADLLNALAARGMTVHIFAASTQQDPIAAQASSAGSDQQQQQAFGESSQQQRQQNQEEGEYT